MRRNRFGSWFLVAFATLAVLAGGVAFAQEQAGSIEGIVSDKDGAVLPGVTVEAMSGGGSTLVAVTDIRGAYRFPRLASSVYKLTAKLDGFVTAEVSNVDLTLGKSLRINFTLQPGTFQDTITVAADTVAIDVSQSATSTSIKREELELLPRGRDFTAVAAMAAGATNDQFAAGLSVDGASGSENRYIIDGIDTTNPQDGLSGQSMMTEFIEEVQVKSAGYAAEYGGAIGGVVNAITKSGGNEFAGSVGAYYRNKSMLGAERPTVYRDTVTGAYATRVYAKDEDTRFEPGFTLGGPILRDKMWFFVAYQPALRDLTRVNDYNGLTYKESIDDQFFSANIKGNISSKFLYKFAANLSPSKQTNALPSKTSAPNPIADFNWEESLPNSSYSLYGDFVATDNLLISGRVGTFTSNTKDTGFPLENEYLYNFITPAINAQLPAELQHVQGFTTNPSNFQTFFDKWERKSAAIDGSFSANFVGSHVFKAGVQYEEITNDVNYGQGANQFIIRYGAGDRFGLGVQGTYGAVEIRRFETFGSVTSKNMGLFVQDSWMVSKNITLNIGVRTEEEKIPYYIAGISGEAIKFSYGDKVAPRLGFAWDVAGDQRWKVYGSYGTYFDITKLNLARGSFGGDRWLSHFYGIEDLDWRNWNCASINNDTSQGEGNGPCTGIGDYAGFLDLRQASTVANGGIDPSLKPMQQREYQIGMDHQLTNDITVGARYVNKTLIRTIEDIGFFYPLPDGGYAESYIIGNPGEGLTGQHTAQLPTQPKAKRDYDALELNLSKRFVNNWMLNANYTYSKLYGNYAGLASSDEIVSGSGRSDPNTQRYFDYLHNAFNAEGQPEYGNLATDRPHQIKVQALYMFPFRLSVGVNQYYGSGVPVSSEASYGGVPFFAWGRGDQGRTPTLTQTDLMLTQSFKVASFDLEASINVLNLFDEDTVIRYNTAKYTNSFFRVSPNCFSDQECFFNQTPFDPDAVAARENNPVLWSYMKPAFWQAARSIRVGLKVSF